MRPAKEFPAAHEQFGETSRPTGILEPFFPSNPCDAISKAEHPIRPRAYHTRIIQTYSTRLHAFHLFQDTGVHPLLS